MCGVPDLCMHSTDGFMFPNHQWKNGEAGGEGWWISNQELPEAFIVLGLLSLQPNR